MIGERKTYDKEAMRARIDRVAAHYLGREGATEGSRLVWDCPGCGKARKFSVSTEEKKGGCWDPACTAHMWGDVFDLVAHFEGLDARNDFVRALQIAAEILDQRPRSGKGSGSGRQRSRSRRPSGRSAAKRRASGQPSPTSPAQRGGRDGDTPSSELSAGHRNAPKSAEADLDRLLDLCHRVYSRILELSPLERRDVAFLRRRGLTHETIEAGRFASMSAERARFVKARLEEEFGREALLRVPGFAEDGETGRLKFTLTGDYLLIPYHDYRTGRVSTIEGRTVGNVPEGMGKYVSLRNAGNHLYVFPGQDPAELEAITEGPMGAIVAAQAGLKVGAIQGCERYRAARSKLAPDGEPGGSLLELRGIDFGGGTVPYIPDFDDPPNGRVLELAPKAARHLAEPQNGRAALCWPPRGMDLDEWLLSPEPDERRERFDELLAKAAPLEDAGERELPLGDGATAAPEPEEQTTEALEGSARDEGPETDHGETEEVDERQEADGPKGSVEPKEDAADADVSSRRSPQELVLFDSAVDRGAAPRDKAAGPRKRTGAERARDEVYRRLLELCSPKEEHEAAMERKGVLREALRVGGFGSLDPARAKEAAAVLVREFGAKRLLSVPGFEGRGTGQVRFCLSTGEYLLAPCFDTGGYLLGLEALPVDPESGEVRTEETVPLTGAGAHLYVFRAYKPTEVEGFCEGVLGALLAAQEDVVLGAIGGFRRYKADSGPRETRGCQHPNAVLPELEGVSFGGRRLAYVPRIKRGEENARAHEVEHAARWLVAKQNGTPKLLVLGEAQVSDEACGRPPGSLGEWLLALTEEETAERLEAFFPRSPVREETSDEEDHPQDGNDEVPGTSLTLRPAGREAALVLALAVAVALVVDAAVGRLHAFSEYVGVGPRGVPMTDDGLLGALRGLAATGPFEMLYLLKGPMATAAGFAVVLFYARTLHLGRLRLLAEGVAEDRWTLHLRERPESRQATGATLLTTLAWAVTFGVCRSALWAAEGAAGVASRLDFSSTSASLVVEQPVLVSAGVAGVAALLFLRRCLRFHRRRAKVLAGHIEH